ncbi:glycosyl transferase [Komagataeibacter rhaeticus]|uniref:glycosyltransferase family 4 protein n=1 Tax=Komagataeibacter rhaeticus TaxID=215221 RepID=UPI0004D48235|nr:glycosyltransferase family 4 protein [Komagataeibacter rhaeticus]KDU97081.1 glycosyl transferase [Komagataeibacter rhaeticus AF1]MBL7240413.1 glycosyltransferase family 4 protein [Komagataeibacter rhaeticus]PYD53773.1 glycosyl transferase [Komagataeibacter rhaeticus]GBQ10329.1 glycosyltransferase [Komagataeibacter rhaeticus DSM 16663]
MQTVSDRPVILQALPALESGGIEHGTLEMAQAIVQAGGTAIVASAGGRLVPRLKYIGAIPVEMELGAKNPISVMRNAGRLRQVMQQYGVHLVHARSRAPAWAAHFACRRLGVPMVTTWHGVHDANLPGKKRYNSVLASGARVIAISRYIATRLRDEYKVGGDRLRLIPRGADMVRFDPGGVRGNRVQKLLGLWDIPDGATVIMLPARVTAWKGHALLIEALAHLERTGGFSGDWVCIFVGETNSREGRQLVAQARQGGIAAHLRFAGHCADMPAAMMLADMVVVPSRRPEPFGRVVVEAQAMGRPVIVSAHGAALETVENGITGFSFPPDDARALAACIRHVAGLDNAEREALAWHARENVRTHYSTQAMQYATLAVYDELLHTRLADTFYYSMMADAPLEDEALPEAG